MASNHKTNKMKINILIVFLLFLAACSSQKNGTSQSQVGDMIEQQAYTFAAKSVFPTEDARYNPRVMFPNGSQLYQLSPGYYLKVTPDSVIAYLPYFGRSFTAPVNPSEGGIKFSSTDFDYKRSMRKGNYEIEIIPHDAKDIRNLYLTISPSGFGSLRILSLNKSSISYNGEIEPNR